MNEPLNTFFSPDEVAAICTRALLGEYGVHGDLVHRLALELGIVHAALHAALVRMRDAENADHPTDLRRTLDLQTILDELEGVKEEDWEEEIQARIETAVESGVMNSTLTAEEFMRELHARLVVARRR